MARMPHFDAFPTLSASELVWDLVLAESKKPLSDRLVTNDDLTHSAQEASHKHNLQGKCWESLFRACASGVDAPVARRETGCKKGDRGPVVVSRSGPVVVQ